MAITSGTPKSDPYKDALEKALAAGAGSSSGGGQVYMGQVSGMYGRDNSNGALSPSAEAQLQKRSKDLIVSEDDALQEYYSWNAKKQSDFVSQLVLAGKVPLGSGMAEGAAQWEKLVKLSAKYTKAGNKISPFDILATYVKASGGGNSWTNAGVWQINTQTGERRYTGPGTYLGDGKAQQVDTRVDLTDPDTARAVSTKLFQDLMGRDPGEGELAAFASALHSAEESNPVVSSTTTQYDMDTGQAISSDSTQSGGVTAEGQAYIGQQQIKKSKEYGAYQAATTYQNAFDAAVFGSPE